MSPVWSKQPLKAIFITFHIFRTLATLPWLLIKYAPKSARPFPEWSMKQCVINVLVRELLVYHYETQSNAMSTVLSDHEKAGDRHTLAKPAKAELYSGILASAIVQPAAVGGLWYPAPPPASTDDVAEEKVVLHFPGGAFVLAYGSEMYGKPVSAAMEKYLKADRTFFAQYRPSASDDTRFPAALQDVLTFYNYILSLGYKPGNIVLSGDSAAGNLLIGLLRHLEGLPDLPLPSSAILVSFRYPISLHPYHRQVYVMLTSRV